MAYEAMNNAGALDARLIVILNDNDMSIAPPVGAMSAYLARLVSSRSYRGLRNSGKRFAPLLPRLVRKTRQARGGICARHRHRRHAVRGTGLLLCRPDRRPQSRSSDPGSGECARHAERADPHSCRDARRARAMRPPKASADKYHGVSKFNVLTGEQKKSTATAPSYTKVFAEALIAEAEKDERIVAITAAMPSGTGLDLFAKKFPDAHLRCRHRRAAWRDLRRGSRRRRHEALRRDLFDLPAARLRSGRARRGDPVAARALRAGPRGIGRRRRPDACRRVRHHLSGDASRLRRDGGGRRSRTDAHGGDRGANRRPALRLPLSARRGPRPRTPGRRHAARNRQGPRDPRGFLHRHPQSRHAVAGMC